MILVTYFCYLGAADVVPLRITQEGHLQVFYNRGFQRFKNPIFEYIQNSGFYGFYLFIARILPRQSLAQMAQMRHGLLWEYPAQRSLWSRVQV
jgi:ABC-type phosphate/phosphonate transport system permease subunit